MTADARKPTRRPPRRWIRRGRGSLYRRLQTLRFLITRDRRAVLTFLGTPYPGVATFTQRVWLVCRFLHITNQVRSYHSQAQMLALADAILRRAGTANLTIVECGCGKGSSTAKLSLMARLAGGRLLAFDSFQGLPANDERHQDLLGRRMEFRRGAFRGRLREVQRTVESFGAPEVVQYFKGWFHETLPPLQGDVDVAFLDVDLLESTRTCLGNLVPRMRPGGIIFTQDGHLRAIAALLADSEFWRETMGVEPPSIAGLGEKKFLAIPMGTRAL